MSTTTSRQDQLKIFYSNHKRLPSVTEARSLFRLKSRNGAYKILQSLASRDFIQKDRAGKFVRGKTFFHIPFLGTVVAGWASPAEEELGDVMDLDEWLIRKPEATFLFIVQGDSMIDAGINDGDYALVERTTDYRDGDLVIAQVDGDLTLKYFRKNGGKVYLEAANPEYKPIYPIESLKIVAVVATIIRRVKKHAR